MQRLPALGNGDPTRLLKRQSLDDDHATMAEHENTPAVPQWAAPGAGPVRIGVRRGLMQLIMVITGCVGLLGLVALAIDPKFTGVFMVLIGIGGVAATTHAVRRDLPALLLDESGFQFIGLNNPTRYGTGVGEHIPWNDVAEFILDANVAPGNTQKLAMARYHVDRYKPTEQGLGTGFFQKPGHYFPPLVRLQPRVLRAVLIAWHEAHARTPEDAPAQ